jgi:3-oxoadipate enol-lactonase
MQVESNGSTFNCRIEGPDDAPVIMLAHGIATELTSWDGVAERLASRFRVLRYDARGHGGSAATPGDYSFAMLADDAIGILDALRIDRAHYCGLSLGGMTALGLALDHPARLKRAIVCDARATALPDYHKAWADRAAQVRAKGMESIAEVTISRWVAPAFLDNKAGVATLREMVLRTSVDGYCGCAAALQSLDFGKRLSEIRLPTLFLVGAEDTGAPPAAMHAMHEAVPGSQYVEIAGAGHQAHLEQPEAVAKAIGDFVAQVEAAPQTA